MYLYQLNDKLIKPDVYSNSNNSCTNY